MAFTNLHLHTEYSALDGMIRIDKLAERIKEMGQDTFAVTDHGTCGGYLKAAKAAKDNQLKFIPGIEAYQVDDRTDKTRGQKNKHLILLARNEKGYRNLTALNFQAFYSGHYMLFDRLIGRTDMELLKKYGKGLICTTSCFAGYVPTMVREGRFTEAKKILRQYQSIFDEVFIEVEAHDMDGQAELNEAMLEIGLELGIPGIVTTDAHYLCQEDSGVHDVLLAIQAKEAVADPNRKLKFGTQKLYIQSEDEIRSVIQDEDLITNTVGISTMCDDATQYLESSGQKMPYFPVEQTEDFEDFFLWYNKKKGEAR